MSAVNRGGRRQDPNSMSSRIRDHLFLGATARETAEQLGCTIGFVNRVQAQLLADPLGYDFLSLAGQVREHLSASLTPREAAEGRNYLTDFASNVRTRMRPLKPAAAPQRATEVAPHGPISAEVAVRMMVDAVRRLQPEVAALRTALTRIAAIVRDGLA